MIASLLQSVAVYRRVYTAMAKRHGELELHLEEICVKRNRLDRAMWDFVGPHSHCKDHELYYTLRNYKDWAWRDEYYDECCAAAYAHNAYWRCLVNDRKWADKIARHQLTVACGDEQAN